MIRSIRVPIFLTILLLSLAAGCARNSDDVLYQTSTLHALLEGVYDGSMTVGELKRQGDFGIGTFNALDGEMVLLDGRCYQVASDGQAREMGDAVRTPFAVATPFGADRFVWADDVESFEAFTAWLDSALENGNLPCAVRIDGEFSYMKTRSVPRQSKPYRRLAEVVKNQPEFEFENVKGTIVGFYLPAYFDGINVPGYHFHFLTEDRRGGGHILDFRAERLRVGLDPSSEMRLVLPDGGAFRDADLLAGGEEEMRAVERGR